MGDRRAVRGSAAPFRHRVREPEGATAHGGGADMKGEEGGRERGVPAYGVSSVIYDRLVGGVLHELWRESFERLVRRYGMRLDRVADVACGTGQASLYLARSGSRVIAVDISEEMLRVAAARLRGRADVLLLRQDMRYLSLPSKVQTLVCAADSLNHLLQEEDVRRALRSFASALEEGGHLLFDVNTAHQLREGQDERDWVFLLGGWRLSWRSEWEEETSSATLTMRLERSDGRGGIWVEVHRERAYPAGLLVAFLEEAGFRRVEVWDAAGLGKPGARSRRLQFVARREEAGAHGGGSGLARK